MKNFHLPLPEQTYSQLKAQADRLRIPATKLAREAVDSWLRQQTRQARRDAIAAYAAETPEPVSTSIAIWNGLQLSTWSRAALEPARDDEPRRSLLGGSYSAIGIGAGRPASGDHHVSRRVQSDSRMAFDYCCSGHYVFLASAARPDRG